MHDRELPIYITYILLSPSSRCFKIDEWKDLTAHNGCFRTKTLL